MSDVKYIINDEIVPVHKLRSTIRDETMLVILENIVTTLKGYTANASCPIHGEPPHVTVFLSKSGGLSVQITNCCETFAQRKTSPLERVTHRFQTAHFRPALRLTVSIQGGREIFRTGATRIDTVWIGRAEPDALEKPDINLHNHGGVEKGVSRRHASIIWWEGALHVVDNGSINGTYLDEQQLEPDKPYMLHDGDLVRLGNLMLTINLVDTIAAMTQE